MPLRCPLLPTLPSEKMTLRALQGLGKQSSAPVKVPLSSVLTLVMQRGSMAREPLRWQHPSFLSCSGGSCHACHQPAAGIPRVAQAGGGQGTPDRWLPWWPSNVAAQGTILSIDFPALTQLCQWSRCQWNGILQLGRSRGGLFKIRACLFPSLRVALPFPWRWNVGLGLRTKARAATHLAVWWLVACLARGSNCTQVQSPIQIRIAVFVSGE